LPLSATAGGNIVVANPPLLPSAKVQVALPGHSPVFVNGTMGSSAVGATPLGAKELISKPLVVPSSWWILFAVYFPQAAHFVESARFAMIVKAACMLGNVLMQISPYPQVRRWELTGCTGEADSAPYVSIAFGGWQWCFYGLFAWMLTKRTGFLILVQSNVMGAVLGSYYTLAFYKHCRSGPFLDSLQRYLSAGVTLALLQVCAMIVLPAERALFLSGVISSFGSFIMAGSMLVTIPAVIRTKDSSSINLPFVWATIFSSLVWCLCGWILNDPLVVGPNVFSTLVGLINLYLKSFYPSSDDVHDKASAKGASPIEAAVALAKDAVARSRHIGLPQINGRSKRPTRKPARSQVEGNEHTDLPNSIAFSSTEYQMDPRMESQIDARLRTLPAALSEPPQHLASSSSAETEHVVTHVVAPPPPCRSLCGDSGGTF